tara:strand:- start:1216 stop:2160 length:945 start_codon:yes stop_codon:yes gene_type:complete
LALIFSSGGGRLGNQLLNIYHLMAISYEYQIKVFKINDSYISSRRKYIMFSIEKNNNNWKLVNEKSNNYFIRLFILKVLIRGYHFLYNFLPNYKSYKIGSKNNFPRYLFGKNLGNNFNLSTLVNEAKKKNIIVSGWGLRDWDLVLKHKKSIIQNVKKCFENIHNINQFINEDYLFVHIRRTDFLSVKKFNEINFSDQIWINSILKICSGLKIYKVVIFSDSNIESRFINILKNKGIKVFLPNLNLAENKNTNFLDLFIYYLSKSSCVLCNASTLTLSIAFLFHEIIYLPSKVNDFDIVNINDAHNYFPISLNWN